MPYETYTTRGSVSVLSLWVVILGLLCYLASM